MDLYRYQSIAAFMFVFVAVPFTVVFARAVSDVIERKKWQKYGNHGD